MAKGFFERRKIFKKANYMDLHPVIKFEYTLDDNSLVTINIPRFKLLFFQKMILKKRSKYIYLKLDNLGSKVWLEIDGKKNVYEICSILKDRLGEELTQAEERVTKFLSILYNNRHISFKEIE